MLLQIDIFLFLVYALERYESHRTTRGIWKLIKHVAYLSSKDYISTQRINYLYLKKKKNTKLLGLLQSIRHNCFLLSASLCWLFNFQKQMAVPVI